ncbi:hypothetical protein GCM10009111_13750 [Colwellia asteriadis]|uniref:Flagella basal body P-ring formation protein FlgA n=1 Tax=Colwellia asteriadis TaxID=517723 RepID=A0ABN1L603_9GAMM
MKLFFYILLFGQFALAKSFATSYDHAYIEELAKSALEAYYPAEDNEKVSITVASIDPRIKVQTCQIPLEANIPENSSGRNVNVKISCDDSTPWNIYLPAKVEVTLPVIVAKKTIGKGSVITADHIEKVYLSATKIRGAIVNNEALVIGAKAEKRIAKGRAFNPRNICLVCEGDIVTIIASGKNFSIKARGEALSSGNNQEQIQVRNSRSNKIITATVKAINTVVINL